MNSLLEELSHLPDRGKIANFLNSHGLVGAAAEIGVDKAFYCEGILAVWKGHTYYAVDLWEDQDTKVYQETHDYPLSYQFALGAAKRDIRIKLMKMLSTEAAKLIPDNSLDWVWIDANHNTQPVWDDMNAWWPKVKTGGVFSGHDYPMPTVRSAVDRWFYENHREFVEVDSSWWSVKL